MLLKKKHMDGSYTQVKVNEDASWTEATDAFVHFLQGCGYIIQGIEIGEYLVEQYGFQRKDLEPLPEEWVERKSEIRRKKHAKEKQS